MTRHLTQAEFARQEGVNRSTVTRWIQSGRITPDANGLINPEDGRRQRQISESTEARHVARKEQFDADKQGPMPLPNNEPVSNPESATRGQDSATLGVGERLSLLHKQASLKRLQAQAELANLELDKAAGLLLERADVEFLLLDFGRHITDLLGDIADRHTSEILQCGSDAARIHKAIEDSMHHVLMELNQHLIRRWRDVLPQADVPEIGKSD